ncbi:MAG: HpcH/HpaI aldolase family protein, partial [Planctomycetota bacterium]
MENLLRARLARGEVTFGPIVVMPSPEVAEAMALAGFDWVWIDAEHGPIDVTTCQRMLQAVARAPATPLVRVADNDPAAIKTVLDAGAHGIVVPMVNSADEARRAVSACRYPPDGIRGLAAGRAQGYGVEFEDYVATANREIQVIVQIETREAVDAVDEIADVPGIDVIFVGCYDLSASLGHTADVDHPEVLDALERVRAAAERRRIPAGTIALEVDRALR